MITFAEIDQRVAASMQRFEQEQKAAQRAAQLTPEQEIRARLDAARFRELIADAALAAGVRPRAIRHVLRDAASVFELRDGALVALNGATDPADPLAPLSVTRWLEQLHATDAYLFTVQRG